ncbi:MAG: protein-L-isoaspartate(D-aspartate) O-methyltransferase [Alphaproteobacteria bacterium]
MVKASWRQPASKAARKNNVAPKDILMANDDTFSGKPGTPDGPEQDSTRIETAALILALRARGISDRSVLKAFEAVPRRLFVPQEYADMAYDDRALPIDCGQTISAPSIVGLMTQALKLTDRHHVLEIGTGSGYQSAILAQLARRVTTIDRYRTLVREAEERWKVLKINNISAVVGDGTLGWKTQAPFDRILVTAAAQEAPANLVAQLVDGGSLIAPIGAPDDVQRLTLFIKDGENVETRDLGGVRFVPMVPGVAHNL